MATKKGAGAKKQAAPLDPKVADRLLDLLSTDNEFRRLFKKDPQAALVKAGWKPPKAPVGAPARKGPPFTPPGPPEMAPPFNCLTVDRIAPKETISRSRDALKAFLTSELTMQPIQLNVATTASRRTRK
jgi:putative modified peptide